jgi:hypothetical protein
MIRASLGLSLVAAAVSFVACSSGGTGSPSESGAPGGFGNAETRFNPWNGPSIPTLPGGGGPSGPEPTPRPDAGNGRPDSGNGNGTPDAITIRPETGGGGEGVCSQPTLCGPASQVAQCEQFLENPPSCRSQFESYWRCRASNTVCSGSEVDEQATSNNCTSELSAWSSCANS